MVNGIRVDGDLLNIDIDIDIDIPLPDELEDSKIGETASDAGRAPSL